MNGQRRILFIMERIAKEACSTKQLTQEIFDTQESSKKRTIQNDIKLLKEYFPKDLISPSKGYYKFLKIPYFIRQVNNKDGLEMQELLAFMMVFDNKMLALFEKDEPKLIQRLKKEVHSIYHIQEYPFEHLNSPFLDDIRRAIKYRRYVSIEYQGNQLNYYKHAQIYKIIYASSNWYVAVYNYADNGYRYYLLLRINFIKKITLLSKTFKKDIRIENFAKNFQSLFAVYNKIPYEVILEVNSIVMKHFLVKKHLRSQETIKRGEDGLTLRFQITNDMEILPLIKRWIPHIKIISPNSLKEKLRKELNVYLDNWD